MCGIAGIVNLRGPPVEQSEIRNLTDRIAHRGPNGAGYWFSTECNVALGHRRLAIIDPGPGGYQPMASADGRHVIVYNGEIYNFLELRRELEAVGERFQSESDTEVILAAWRNWREGMLLRFNGMWALAIYDTQSGEMFLARDRFGIKPLLYALTPERFVFASEHRALVHSGLIQTSVDVDVARRLMLDAFSVEGSERTLNREVHRLQAGHFMWLREGKRTIGRWWCTVDHLPVIPNTEGERVEQFGELFRSAVALRMRSDVPIGTCLSGGFDSTAVICEMAEHARAGMGPRGSTAWRHAFVAAFSGAANDERPMAEEAAKWAGVAPTIVEIGRDDATREIDRILDDNDDVYISLPSAAWLVYRELAKRGVLVSLDGHGADELMGAYRQEGQSLAYYLRNSLARLSSSSVALTHWVDVSRAMMLKGRGCYFLRGGLSQIPPRFALAGESDALPEEWDALNRRLYRLFHGTVLPTILRNFDRVSMAHGIEVRMPFMDWRLVTYTMALPGTSKSSDTHTKWIARRAMQGRMPEDIRMGRRKIGFNSPMPEWLNGPLAGWIASLLNQKVPAFSEFVDEARLDRKVGQLNAARGWDWQSVGAIWPYLNMKWSLARL
ncbi:asparagine synthase (glutamine-hydrolyzing) [Bradyrhizobium sp.]|uniref:asparagine synthase (glutamine-hydrolyzing) n=1 Tax=Bradyrhizobium sp. TaxID=376 RepID=UPI0040381323